MGHDAQQVRLYTRECHLGNPGRIRRGRTPDQSVRYAVRRIMGSDDPE
ncbi:hypothetical protein ACH47B_24580 [Rhodococcus sp. NPDC019627]